MIAGCGTWVIANMGERRERARHKGRELALLGQFLARTLIPAAIILAIYAVMPVTEVFGRAGAAVLIVIALGVYTYLVIHQMRRLATSAAPLMIVGQALVIAVVLFVAIFALGYAALSAANPSYFSEPLTKASALYFSMTVTSTVGFGDIVAVKDASRTLVTFQMFMALVVLAAAVRGVSYAASAGFKSRHRTSGDVPVVDAIVTQSTDDGTSSPK